MMLSPVSNLNVSRVRFAGEGAAANPLERAGAYSRQAEEVVTTEAKPEKKSTGKTMLKLVGGLALIAAGLVGLQKFGAVKVLESTEGTTLMKKAGHYLAKAGEFIGKYTYDPAAKLCTKLFKGKAAS